MMVHNKKPVSFPWPNSSWINIDRTTCDGNWIPDEGEALKALLNMLLQQHQVPKSGIFLISPFRDVVRNLRGIGRHYRLDPGRVGTIHTTQGKEADVVLMMLGGGTAGARDWAASKPNLLNVAVSRSKTRLYIIGDRCDWLKRKYFDVLAEKLPEFREGDGDGSDKKPINISQSKIV